MICTPKKDTLVLRARCDISPIWREASFDLIGHVSVAFVFTDQAQVPEVVQTDPAVSRGYQNPVLARHGLYTSHLPASTLLAPGALDMDGCVILQLIGGEEDNSSVVSSNNDKLSCHETIIDTIVEKG